MRHIFFGCVASLAVFVGIAIAQTGAHNALLQDGIGRGEGDPAPVGGLNIVHHLQVGATRRRRLRARRGGAP